MSVLNVWLAPDYLLIGVDTQSVQPDGTRSDVCKAFPLAASGCILAARGNSAFLLMAVASASVIPGGYDEVSQALPNAAKTAFQAIAAATLDPSVDTNELVLCGFSKMTGRAAGMSLIQINRKLGFAAEAINQQFLAPHNASLEPIPDPSTPELMFALAVRQVRLLRATDPGVAAGGRFCIMAMTKAGATVWPGVDLEPS